MNLKAHITGAFAEGWHVSKPLSLHTSSDSCLNMNHLDVLSHHFMFSLKSAQERLLVIFARVAQIPALCGRKTTGLGALRLLPVFGNVKMTLMV